ncbi:MAG: hypothetical protein KGQ59_11170 [Bdellovibrionales bacterium]|nr:hypothetical protein [Bdellovibrionales bacterium]
MSKTTPRPIHLREVTLALLCSISLSICFAKLWYKPRAQILLKDKVSIEELHQKISSDQLILVELQKMENNGESLPNQDPRMTLIREANSSFANIIKTLSGTDDPDLFSIKNISVEKEEPFLDYNKVLFLVELEAPFLHVGRFLEKLEKSDLLTEVLEIEANRIDPELKRCTVRLRLFSYVNRS